MRTKQQNNQPTKKGAVKTGEEKRTAASGGGGGEKASQSLHLPVGVNSPIFARKTNLDALMAPISMSPSKDEGKKIEDQLSHGGRERSWSEGLHRRRMREIATEDEPSPNNKGKDKEKENKKKSKGRRISPSPPTVGTSQTGKTGDKAPTTAHRVRTPSPLTSPPATSQRKFDDFQTPRRTQVKARKGKRSSRTPPAQPVSTPVDYPPGFRWGHRRSTSYTCRAEIFESVNTPSKEGERRSSHDLCKHKICLLYYPCLQSVGLNCSVNEANSFIP